jgi:hypothetical protein
MSIPSSSPSKQITKLKAFATIIARSLPGKRRSVSQRPLQYIKPQCVPFGPNSLSEFDACLSRNNNMSDSPLSFRVRPHADDLPLFQELGLPPFDLTSPAHDYEVGTVLLSGGNAVVRIALDALPAQFWKFYITDIEGHSSIYHTGSGLLSSFWPSVALIAENRLVCVDLGSSTLRIR